MADDITPGELSRRLADLTEQVRGFGISLAELMRRDVYEAHRQADQAEVARLRADVERVDREADERERSRTAERAGTRRTLWGAVLACIGTIVATVVTAVILR